jgi:hypothetical protein
MLNMDTENLSKSAISTWANCVIYALGMIAANYVVGIWAVFIVIVDLILIGTILMTNLNHRLRFSIVIGSVTALHFAVILRPESQPVANLWLAAFSLILFLASLFIPEKSNSKTNEPTDIEPPT